MIPIGVRKCFASWFDLRLVCIFQVIDNRTRIDQRRHDGRVDAKKTVTQCLLALSDLIVPDFLQIFLAGGRLRHTLPELIFTRKAIHMKMGTHYMPFPFELREVVRVTSIHPLRVATILPVELVVDPRVNRLGQLGDPKDLILVTLVSVFLRGLPAVESAHTQRVSVVVSVHVDGDQNRRVTGGGTTEVILPEFIMDLADGGSQPIVIGQRIVTAKIISPKRKVGGVNKTIVTKITYHNGKHTTVFERFNVQLAMRLNSKRSLSVSACSVHLRRFPIRQLGITCNTGLSTELLEAPNRITIVSLD